MAGTIWRWKSRMLFRHFAYEVRHTLNGKLAVAMLAFAVFAFPGLFATRPSVGDVVGVQEAAGILAAGHLFLAAAFVLAVTAGLAQAFVVERDQEPLSAVPFALPAVAAYRVLVLAVGFSTTYLLGFFYLFHGRLLASALGFSAVGIAAHAASTVTLLFVTGILVAAFLRRGLSDTRLLERADVVHKVCGILVLLSFLALPVLPGAVQHRWPGAMTALSGLGDGGLAIPPLALAHAAASGDLGRVVLLGAAHFGVVALAWIALIRWLPKAPSEIPFDLQPAAKRHATVFFRVGADRPLARRILLFWSKDVAAPFARQPSRYVLQQWGLVCLQAAAIWGIRHGTQGGTLSPNAGVALLGATLVAVPAFLAGAQCLGSLGREGEQLALLRPVLSGRELLVAKGVAHGVYVTVHSVAYAILLLLIASWIGIQHPNWAPGLATALVAGFVFSLGAIAVGFLLPDLGGGNSSVLPGASFSAKFVYAATSAYLVTVAAAACYAAAAGLMPPSAILGGASFIVLLTTVGSLAIAAWAVHRFPSLEP